MKEFGEYHILILVFLILYSFLKKRYEISNNRLKSICIDIIDNFDDLIFIGLIDENSRLLTEKHENNSNSLIELSNYQVINHVRSIKFKTSKRKNRL